MKKFSLLILLSIAMPIATIAMYNDNNEKNDPNTPSKNRVIQPKNPENQEVGQEEEASLESEFGNPKTPAKQFPQRIINVSESTFEQARFDRGNNTITIIGEPKAYFNCMSESENNKKRTNQTNANTIRINSLEEANNLATNLTIKDMLENNESESNMRIFYQKHMPGEPFPVSLERSYSRQNHRKSNLTGQELAEKVAKKVAKNLIATKNRAYSCKNSNYYNKNNEGFDGDSKDGCGYGPTILS